VKGLLSNVESRNGWTLAEAAGHPTAERMQKLLRRAVWDEAGDIKQDSETVGVARRYTGVTGQVENCRVAVFAAKRALQRRHLG